MTMKLLLVLFIVSSLGILTMLAERKDASAMNDDVSSTNYVALTKREVGKHTSGTHYCFLIERFSLNIALQAQLALEGLPDIRRRLGLLADGRERSIEAKLKPSNYMFHSRNVSKPIKLLRIAHIMKSLVF